MRVGIRWIVLDEGTVGVTIRFTALYCVFRWHPLGFGLCLGGE